MPPSLSCNRRWFGWIVSGLGLHLVAGAALADELAAPARPPALLLAMPMPAHVDVGRYLVSEKLDGVRAYWDGQALWFRSGNRVPAPAWFLARLPRQPLDGELWLGRGRFETVSGWVRKELAVDAEWAQLRYMVFELPGAPGDFAQRARQIEAVVVELGWPQLQAVQQFRVADLPSLKRRLAEVVSQGAEGLMLHRADAPYLTGRQDVLLKLKPVDDAEAVVLAHVPGQGKYRGQLGALQVRRPDGRVFRVGTGLSDALRAAPPPVGSTITYTYRGYTRTGLPRFPAFLRVRLDP